MASKMIHCKINSLRLRGMELRITNHSFSAVSINTGALQDARRGNKASEWNQYFYVWSAACPWEVLVNEGIFFITHASLLSAETKLFLTKFLFCKGYLFSFRHSFFVHINDQAMRYMQSHTLLFCRCFVTWLPLKKAQSSIEAPVVSEQRDLCPPSAINFVRTKVNPPWDMPPPWNVPPLPPWKVPSPMMWHPQWHVTGHPHDAPPLTDMPPPHSVVIAAAKYLGLWGQIFSFQSRTLPTCASLDAAIFVHRLRIYEKSILQNNCQHVQDSQSEASTEQVDSSPFVMVSSWSKQYILQVSCRHLLPV